MSQFVFAFRGQADRETSAEQEAAWGNWFQELGGSVSDFGHRVGQATRLGVGAADDVLTGYVVVNADSFEAAVTMAKGCPGLANGGGVDIGEAVEM